MCNKKINFEELKKIDIKTVNIENLVDIESINIDTDLSYEEKLEQYIEQVKNPFFVKVGNFIVKQIFEEDENSLTIERCMQGLADNV